MTTTSHINAARDAGQTLDSSYLNFHANRDDAMAEMVRLNRSLAGKKNLLFVVCDGPDDNFAVCDLDTAIELGGLYEWSF